MSNRALLKERKKIILYAFSIFITLSLAYLLITLVIQSNSDKIYKKEIISSEKRLVDLERRNISNKVNALISDILYISDSLKISNTSIGNYSELKQQWIAFSNRKKIYDQIRFIDKDGNEVIRVNYAKEGSYITKEEELQNKKNRYYFTDTIFLNENQIYISQLDINVENGKIEEPIKPMIRLSKSFYGENGKLEGIIVLNYLANDMLEHVKDIAMMSKGSVNILNSDGYWIYNSQDSSKEWAFMYDNRKNESLKNEYPDEWLKIEKEEKSSFITLNGIYNYTNIFKNYEFDLNNDKNSLVLGFGDLYIGSNIPLNSQNGKLFSNNTFEALFIVLKKNYIVYFLILGISLIFSILITMNKIEKDKIKYFSEYDAMTGVYNRRAGIEKLTALYKEAMKNTRKISICFIDINGLKEVNDFLGHEAGDELILSVISGIRKNIRENDFVARLGGDEFLIILEGLNEQESENIWKCINKEYENINNNENRKYIISASHGIEEFQFKSNEYIETIINHADEKMYNEKRIIKKDLKVVRL